MEDTNKISALSSTSEDNMKNRFHEFVLFATIEFNQAVATQFLISDNKNNAKINNGAKYFGKVVEAGVKGAGFLEGPIPISKFSGKVSFHYCTSIKSL